MANGFKINANIKEVIKNLNDIFDGGTSGQVLVKSSSTDYAFDWGAQTDTVYTHPNHSGDVTSVADGAQTIDPTAISGKSLVTSATGDMVLLWDATDSALKKANVSDFAGAEANDLTTAVTWTNIPIANVPTGTTSVTVSLGDHTHDSITDTNLLDKSATETVSGAYTFSSVITVPRVDLSSTTTIVQWEETDVAADNQKWRFMAAGAAFKLQTVNDAESVAADIFTVERTGTVVDSFAVAAPLTATSYGGVTEANLVDKTATETISGDWTTTADRITVNNGAPRIMLEEQGVTADNGTWRLLADGEAFFLDVMNDAQSSGASVFAVQRTGNTIDSFAIAAPLTATSFGGITSANLLDKSDQETVSGAYIFTGGITVTTNPIVAGSVAADFAAVTATSYGGITEANLVDKSADETISGFYTFTGSGRQQAITISSANPWIALNETGVTADNAYWYIQANAEALTFGIEADDHLSGADWCVVQRTGPITIDSIAFAAPVTATAFGGITSANLCDKSDQETIAGGWTFTDLTSSFGGVTGSNLLDKGATETVSGAYTFSSNSCVIGGVAASNLVDKAATETIAGTWTIGGVSSGNLVDKSAAEVVTGNWSVPSNINEQNVSYTLVLGDAGQTIYKASGGAGETITIPANASVAFPIGTYVEIVNAGGGDLSIAITSDTLEGTDGSQGTRTLPDNDIAVIHKVASTTWRYSASGVDHVHNTFDRASSVESGATVFSNIVVLDGITTNVATRELTAGDISALGVSAQAADSVLLGGIGMSATGDAAPGADKVVRTNTSGHTYVDFLNTTSGATATDPTKIFVGTTTDDFLRYMTPANFISYLEGEEWTVTGHWNVPSLISAGGGAASYTLVLADAGKTVYKTSGGAGETITIPANASVAFTVGTYVEIVNDGGGDLTIAITTDTLDGTDGATGSRTLGDGHVAVIHKLTSTLWKYAASDL